MESAFSVGIGRPAMVAAIRSRLQHKLIKKMQVRAKMTGHAQLMRQIQTRRWSAGTQSSLDNRVQNVERIEAALAEARAELELSRRSHEAAREHDGRLERQLRQMYALWRPGWPTDLAGDVCGRIFA